GLSKGRSAHAMDRAPDFEIFLSRIQSPALQLLAQHWHAARGNKMMPSWTDLPLSALSPYGKLLWGFDYDPRSELFTGRFSGAKLSRFVGEKFPGGRL